MTHTPRYEPTLEEARIVERGLAGVAWYEARYGAFTDEEMEAARRRVEESMRRQEAARRESDL